MENFIKLPINFKIYFSYDLFYVKGLNGYSILKLPPKYFYFINNNFISLKFLTYFFYKTFLNLFTNLYSKLYYYYYFKFKLQGLGFRIRKISVNFYKFFFTSTNFYYLHVPSNFLIKLKKRRLFYLSYDFCMLKILSVSLILLKKLIVYRLRGLISPKKIYFIKLVKNVFNVYKN